MLINGGSDGPRRYQGIADSRLNEGINPKKLPTELLLGGTGQPLKQTSPGGTFKTVRALLGSTVPVKKAEMPATTVVARMLSVPGFTLTVSGAALVPTTPLKA
jgi:hypothetical protein